MGTRSSGWWDGTWNPVGGCLAASPGCRHCYAAKLAATQHTARRVPLYDGVTEWRRGRPIFNGEMSVLPAHHQGWTWPLTWRGAKHPVLGDGEPSLIFVGDMADLFLEGRPWSHIDQVTATVAASHHLGLLLTKRADRLGEYFSTPRHEATIRRWQRRMWLGFSAERQREFDERWPPMRELAASGWTVYSAVAPMITPVRLPADFLENGERTWVICSGEQGPGARPMDPDWARALRDQCAEAGVPFFLNQMAGRKDIPLDLFVRQFPSGGRPPR
ncbi:MAG TPA: DUF5131 family protein [Methyloceanibacter sp.]|nr:DUF5131 family protein [Methyloceanibacter sp.]